MFDYLNKSGSKSIPVWFQEADYKFCNNFTVDHNMLSLALTLSACAFLNILDNIYFLFQTIKVKYV